MQITKVLLVKYVFSSNFALCNLKACSKELSVFLDNIPKCRTSACPLIGPSRIYSPIKLILSTQHRDFIRLPQDALSTLLPTFISISSSFASINSFNSFHITVNIVSVFFYAYSCPQVQTEKKKEKLCIMLYILVRSNEYALCLCQFNLIVLWEGCTSN